MNPKFAGGNKKALKKQSLELKKKKHNKRTPPQTKNN